MTFMDLIRSNKKRPALWAVLQFSVFQDLTRLLKFLSTDQSCLAQVVHYLFLP